jgi:ferritin-like metal-binding protein YciE
MTANRTKKNKKDDDNNSNADNTTSDAFGRNITTIYGLNLALSYENASVDRLEQRLSQCSVIEVRKALERHLKETREQQNRLRKRIEVLSGGVAGIGGGGGKSDNAVLVESDGDTMKPTNEKGRLPIPEPPASLKAIMDSVGTDSERDVWESVNDLIVEKAETIMYKAGIDALKLLQADKKTIDVLKKNLREEEAFGKWLEKNNPRIAKKLMTEQMRKGKKGTQQRQRKEKQEQKEEEEAAATTAMPQ